MSTAGERVSLSLQSGFVRLREQRETFAPLIKSLPSESVWLRPVPAVWAAGDTLLHLVRTMRVYSVLVGLSRPILFPVAWLLRNRPYETGIVDLFAEMEVAGKHMKATRLLVPHRPVRLPSAGELFEQLEKETRLMEEKIGGMAEGVAGHFRIFDPAVGSPNLIQRVQLLGFHERHHFKIIDRLLE